MTEIPRTVIEHCMKCGHIYYLSPEAAATSHPETCGSEYCSAGKWEAWRNAHPELSDQ